MGRLTTIGAEVVNTSQFEPGRIYIDFRTLTLPASLAPGNYVLELVVYDWQTNVQLLLPDGSTSLTLDTITIDAS